jgi:SAM-dependent methyltransferase
MARLYLLLIAAVTGAAVLALEVLAARVMAPALGSGAVTWAVLLAVALGVLAVGNVMGGLLSGRAPLYGVIAWPLLASALYLAFLSRSYGAAARWAAEQPVVLGAFIAAVITQAVPLGLLGCIVPAILHYGRRAAGRWAGGVLAAGSCGGIAGALGAALFLLPGFGLARSYQAVAVALLLAAAPVVWLERRWLAAALLAVVALLLAVFWYWHTPVPTVQSFYGEIEIRENALARVMLIDGLQQTGLPRNLAAGDGLRYGYLLEAALLMQPKPSRALVVGLGGGLAPRLLAAHGVECESVELDPRVVESARREFGFAGRATVADGRAYLRASSERFDLIFLDVCTADRLALQMFTVEAMRVLCDRLSLDGILTIQFIGDDGPWSASLARTVEEVFGDCLMLAERGKTGRLGPRWLFAARERLPALPQHVGLSSDDVPWDVVRLGERGCLLTDDHFPAELDWARLAAAWRSQAAFNP